MNEKDGDVGSTREVDCGVSDPVSKTGRRGTGGKRATSSSSARKPATRSRKQLIIPESVRARHVRPLPERPYNVIYADPPWQYNDRRDTDTRFCGGAMAHYSTLDIDAMCAIDVASIADENAMLFLWCTWPIMLDPKVMGVHRLCEAWDFVPSTVFKVWTKTNRSAKSISKIASQISRIDSDFDASSSADAMRLIEKMMFFGIGWFSKSNTEFVIACRRKNGKPFKSVSANYIGQLTYAPITSHSEKPASVRNAVYDFCGKYLCPDCRTSYDYKIARTCHVEQQAKTFAKRTDSEQKKMRPLCTSELVEVTRLEMFSRHVVPGWDAMGWDLSGTDIRDDVAMAAGSIRDAANRMR